MRMVFAHSRVQKIQTDATDIKHAAIKWNHCTSVTVSETLSECWISSNKNNDMCGLRLLIYYSTFATIHKIPLNVYSYWLCVKWTVVNGSVEHFWCCPCCPIDSHSIYQFKVKHSLRNWFRMFFIYVARSVWQIQTMVLQWDKQNITLVDLQIENICASVPTWKSMRCIYGTQKYCRCDYFLCGTFTTTKHLLSCTISNLVCKFTLRPLFTRGIQSKLNLISFKVLFFSRQWNFNK